MDYTTLKKQVLEKYFGHMNDMQRKAVFTVNGALLIIAGAGSGKTTVLVNRIANIILFGSACESSAERELSESDYRFVQSYLDGEVDNSVAASRLSEIFAEDKVMPWRILAVTFTNKAASELKERLLSLGANVDGIWASTFHSACVRILRTDIEELGLGYKSNFTVYDADDSLRVIKNIMKERGLSEKAVPPKSVQNAISRAKDQLITPEKFITAGKNGEDYILSMVKTIYTDYRDHMLSANALDFDDIIMITVRLLEQCGEVRERWQTRFRYIMVDEYQDTNMAQYRLVSLLSGKSGNLCVVGDEDQSIYRFRGATIENILSFERQFDAKTVKLEQNYRSTETILAAANAVIENNTQHKQKTLWSKLGKGEKVALSRFSTEQEEAMFVADRIMESLKEGRRYSDNVVLYRSNAQSRTIETALAKSGIPYRIIGGVRFYERKEIKDIVAYLSVLNNNFDETRFSRIVNEPLRGIGTATLDEILHISHGMGLSPVEVLLESEGLPTLSRKSKILVPLGELFAELSASADNIADGSIIDEVLDMFGYRDALKAQGTEGEIRLENINELKSNLITFAKENEGCGLSEFLEQVALVSDIDSYEQDEDRVVLMTIHSAKGLEFDTVFLIGAEENIFPGYRSMLDPTEIEEERRLAYVAITRAKRKLHITCVKQRMLYGQTMRNRVSRFAAEIPAQYMEYNDKTVTQQREYIPQRQNTGYLQQRPKPAAAEVSNEIYNEGDRVQHKVFGEGTVLSAKPMGGDWLLEVAFDTQGTKKIAAKFSKMKKI